MCGITGIWIQDSSQDRIRTDVTEAVTRLRHRGPDDHGIWMNGSGLGLGHTRLAILELSDLGHQPMISTDGRYVMVYNGEIYNFAEIRSRLTGVGYSFAGNGDTEVILHAFKEWGSDAVKQFIGMFAIALWDDKEKRLELYRDRIGVKPLHYGWDGRNLWFGSELKALRAYTHWSPEVDRQSLGEFLQYGYISGDRTIYKGVHKLKPGHRLTLERGKQPIVEPYWSVHDFLDRSLPVGDSNIEKEIEELLIDAFQYRMVSDVPVGVYLSGGVDSSLVTAILAKHANQDIHTFTIGFSENTHDESRWAKKVAEHCGTIHTEYILSVNDALAIAKNWGNLFDEPFGDSSGIPTLLVSRLASKEVKVVLSADGGDELFSGYQVYSNVLQRMQQTARIPQWLRRPISSGMSLNSPRLPQSGKYRFDLLGAKRGDLSRRVHRLKSIMRDSSPGKMMDMYMSNWLPDEINRLIGNYSSPRLDADSYPGPPASKISLWDFHHYLPEDVLTKVDRTTMAVSIEGREPMLDHRLAEYAFALPPHLRRGQLGPKHLLKKILYRYVPRELVDRPKQGFGIPLDTWMRTELKPLVTEYLDEGRISSAGIFDAKMVKQATTRFYRGDTTLSTPLWYLLAFEMWRETWG